MSDLWSEMFNCPYRCKVSTDFDFERGVRIYRHRDNPEATLTINALYTMTTEQFRQVDDWLRSVHEYEARGLGWEAR